jgi:type II secretory pathway component GspD/PulD (secretin)
VRLSGRINLLFHVACTRAHIIGGTTFCRETQNCVKTFLKIFEIFSGDELTPNIINQSVFSTREVTTSLSICRGQTVVLGGLMRKDAQKTEDKTIIIGDIPLVGGAFCTNTEQDTKRNSVIFVTAKIVTSAGLPLKEEEEKGFLPLEPPEVPAYKK